MFDFLLGQPMIWARNGHPDKDLYVVMVFMQMVCTFDSHVLVKSLH